MLVRCEYCGKNFKSEPARRGHLRACPAYQAADPAELPAEPGLSSAYMAQLPAEPAELPGSRPAADFDPARHVRSELAAETARLRLRQVQAAHKALDERQREERDRAYAEALDRLQAERKTAEEARDRRRRGEAEAGRAQRRREIIQRVKARVIEGWWSLRYTIPPEVKGQALQQIEQALSALAVDELPWGELLQIAEGIRDRHYRPVMQAEDAAKAETQARARQTREEQARREQAVRALTEKKHTLLQHGVEFVTADLEEHAELEPSERREIVDQVGRELEQELTGQESEDEIEELVDQKLFDLLDADAEEEADYEEEE